MEPTRQQARELVGAAERSTARVRTEARWYVAFLGGLGLVSAGWFVSLGWLAAEDRGVLVSAVVFGVLLAALCAGLLPRARASRRGFARRWIASMLGWGAAYSLALTWGLLGWRDTPSYWWVAALVVAAPPWIGAYVEARGQDVDGTPR
jgi:hypothetical protein